jgi:hypothetical protein
LQSASAAVFVTDAAYESDSEVPQDGQRTSKVAIDLSVEGGEKGVGAVRPWEGAVVKPDDAPPNDGTQPDAQLELEWIYGYKTLGVRSNLAIDSRGRFIYPAASVIVAYDAAAHTQEFFRAHTDDVVCLAQHPRRRDVIATGQMATVVKGRSADPFACVYDWQSQQTWQLPPMAGQRKVVSLAFSGDGRFLATAGCDNDFTITVWDWENKAIVATCKSASRAEITHLAFQGGHEARPATYEICAVGPKAVTFYYLGAGGRAPLTAKQVGV